MRATEASSSGELTRAVGVVAVESSCADEVMREILSSLSGSYLTNIFFEGRNSEWLEWACNALLDENDPHRHTWSQEQHNLFNKAIESLSKLRLERNWIIHGTWTDAYPIGEADEVVPRPLGATNEGDVLVCNRSKERRMWGGEHLFTVSDIEAVGMRIRESWKHLAETYTKMWAERTGFDLESEVNRDMRRQLPLPRWYRPDSESS